MEPEITQILLKICDPAQLQEIIWVHRNYFEKLPWFVKKNFINDPVRGTLKKNKNSIFKDIIQIEVDLPPSHPIFDKFIFDKVLIMLTSLPPLEFLTKIMTF